MIQEIKNLRVKIDGLAQLTENVKHDHIHPKNSKEIEKAVDNLYLAKAWLGKILRELGNENPYKSGYKTKEDIEPTADVSSGEGLFKDDFELLWWKNELNHIEKVDSLRTKIEDLIKNTSNFSDVYSSIEIEQSFVYKYLCEARFWLDFELQNIKENELI